MWTGSYTTACTAVSTFLENDSIVTVETFVTVQTPSFNQGWNVSSTSQKPESSSSISVSTTTQITSINAVTLTSIKNSASSSSVLDSVYYEYTVITQTDTLICTGVNCESSNELKTMEVTSSLSLNTAPSSAYIKTTSLQNAFSDSVVETSSTAPQTEAKTISTSNTATSIIANFQSSASKPSSSSSGQEVSVTDNETNNASTMKINSFLSVLFMLFYLL